LFRGNWWSFKNGGFVSVVKSGEGTWLQVQGVPAASLRGMDRGYSRPLASLVSLAAGVPTSPIDLEVQESPDKPWWPVYSASLVPGDLSPTHELILQYGDVTPTALSTWLDRVELLGPLPSVVASSLRGPVQLETQVLVLSTVAEGLHRRLFPDVLRFPTGEAITIAQAAVGAAAAVDPNAEQAVSGFLSHLHEVGYLRRLRDLGDVAESAAPGVIGKASAWRSIVYEARNDFAHRRADLNWLDEADIDRYLVVALSLRWMLQAVLLLQAGLSPSLLRGRFATHTPYNLFLQQAHQWQPALYEI
jgi:hypothetical protein